MTQTSWFSRLVQRHKLEHWLVNRREDKDSSSPSGQCPCDVLVQVGEGRAYEGPLTCWNHEEEVLWEHLGRPYAARSLEIKRVIVLQRPALVQRPLRLKVPIWGPSVPMSDVHLRGFAPPHANEALHEAGICQTLQVSSEQLRDFLKAPVCLAIPPILSKLIKVGAWKTVMVLANWHQRRRGNAYHAAFAAPLALDAWHDRMKAAGMLTSHVSVPALKLSQSDALKLGKSLQCWAPQILEGYAGDADDEESSTQKLLLEEFVLKLQSFAGPVCIATQSRQKVSSHDTVVKALCTSMNLRNKSQLAPMLQEAVAALFPGLDQDMTVDIPSGSTLSRRQILVDAAYSCFWRSRLQEHTGPLYLWADSSPQGGVDWLLSIVSLIRQEDMESVVAASDFLYESTERFQAACAVDDKDSMLEIAEKRHQCGLCLTSSMIVHRQIPMALGSGCTSLEHKVRCVCRKLFAESQSLAGLKNLLGRVRSVCTDMGTEFAIPDFEGASLESVLPEFLLEPELQSEDMLSAGEAAAASHDGFIFPQTLLVPGILHIVHNMTKEIDVSLSFWKEWLPGFKSIAKLLHEDHLRRRLIARCIRDTRFAQLESLFEKGVPKPAEWRWGTVSAIAPRILSLRGALRTIWNPQLFGGNEDPGRPEREQAEGEAGQETLNVDTITACIRSKKWWLQLEAVSELNRLAEDFASWAEGCECHGWLRPVHAHAGPVHLRRQAQFSQEAEQLLAARTMLGLKGASGGDGANFVCPLAGRRAPDLACGAATEHFQQARASQTNDIRQAGLDMDMEFADVEGVLEDVSRCTAAMQGYVAQKLQCWNVLPWKLCGIAHPNPARSRQCASACLQLFRDAPQAENLHHRITWKHLCEGSQTRLELEAFVAGQDLSSLENLKTLVYELKFVPTVERIQEGDHSIVHRMVHYRKVSGPYVACALRVPEIRSLLPLEKAYSVFLRCFEEVQNLDDMAKRFGFHKHVQWQLACHEKHTKKKKIILAGLLMYSMDFESQFSKMQAVKKAREKRERERQKVHDDWKAQFETKRRFCFESLEEAAMADHLQSELQIGRLYSVPASAAAISSLQSSLQPFHLQPPPLQPRRASGQQALQNGQEDMMTLSSDVFEFPSLGNGALQEGDAQIVDGPGQGPRQPVDNQHEVFFRLTCARPSRHKLVRLPAAAARRLSQHDFCVTLHRCVEVSGGDRGASHFVEVEPATAQTAGGFTNEAVGVMSVFRSDMTALRERMLGWSSAKDLSFTLANCASVMSRDMLELLNDMVLARAFSISESEVRGHLVVRASEAARLQCLRTLTELGMACLLREAEGDQHYAFTQLGANSLRHVRKCTAPARFFKSPAELADIPATEWPSCTTWELLCLLQHCGWQLRQAPQAVY